MNPIFTASRRRRPAPSPRRTQRDTREWADFDLLRWPSGHEDIRAARLDGELPVRTERREPAATAGILDPPEFRR